MKKKALTTKLYYNIFAHFGDPSRFVRSQTAGSFVCMEINVQSGKLG